MAWFSLSSFVLNLVTDSKKLYFFNKKLQYCDCLNFSYSSAQSAQYFFFQLKKDQGIFINYCIPYVILNACIYN